MGDSEGLSIFEVDDYVTVPSEAWATSSTREARKEDKSLPASDESIDSS